MAEKKPGIIGLTEVWIKERYNIQGYHPVFRRDRPEDKKGGVMLFVHENLLM